MARRDLRVNMEAKPLIYTVGDSHAWHAWLKIPFVKTGSYGPMTMYRFGKDRPIVTDSIPDDVIVCFCWGEIDCRCHVNKYQPWKKTIDHLVENYIDAIKENTKRFNDVWIFNVVPPPRREDSAFENPGFPFVGTNEERLDSVRYMNNRLRSSGFVFVDVYDKYCDAEGFLRMDMSDNHVHIADEKPLIRWLVNHLDIDVNYIFQKEKELA